jgi:hypothetical protein
MTIEGNGTAIGWQSIKAINGIEVQVSRGAAVGTLTAVPGDTLFDFVDEAGHTSRGRVRDYLVSRADFEAIVGDGLKPERGDKFVETVADYSRTFEAAELGDEVFRWWDKSGLVLRIHTVETFKVTTTTAGA